MFAGIADTSDIPDYAERIIENADDFARVRISNSTLSNFTFPATFISSIGRLFVVIISEGNTFSNNIGNIKLT